MQINVTRDKALTSDQIWRMKKGQIYISVSLSLLFLSPLKWDAIRGLHWEIIDTYGKVMTDGCMSTVAFH